MNCALANHQCFQQEGPESNFFCQNKNIIMKATVPLILANLIVTFLSAQTAEIKVSDFGAVPNDGKDDTPATIKMENNTGF
jgi:hypothetical protein